MTGTIRTCIATTALQSTVGLGSVACAGPNHPAPIEATPVVAALELPRIHWEGGPDYWKKFAKADKAEVLCGNRTVPVDAAGSFADTFTSEYAYHIYKVKL